MRDLLPAYLAGEASADTKALVEEYRRQNPEFAADLNRAAAETLAVPVTPPPATELDALARTRRILRWRGALLGAAIFFSLLPFTFVFGRGIRFWMLRDAPEVAIASAVVALLCWLAWRRAGLAVALTD
jgi:hypothetical protein